MKKFRVKATIGLIFFCGLLLVFQNCSNNIRLKPLEMASAKIMGKVTALGTICLPADEVLDTLVIRNINIKILNGKLVEDSDGDGLSDYEEKTLGSDMKKRRSGGKVLDSLCQQLGSVSECANLDLVCTGSLMGFGLNDCDVTALDLDGYYGHPTQGLDTDKDGVSDYFEIQTGTFPNIHDANGDLDHDTIANFMEIEQGSNPRQADVGLPLDLLLQIQKSKLPPSSSCAGDEWQVNINYMPLVPIASYTSDLDAKFNHAENENLIFLNLKTRPRSGSNVNASMYLLVKGVMAMTSGDAMNQSFNFTFTDFQKLGEMEP